MRGGPSQDRAGTGLWQSKAFTRNALASWPVLICLAAAIDSTDGATETIGPVWPTASGPFGRH